MSSFAAAFAKLLRGSLAAQLLGFAVLPLLSRLYTPADFGLMQGALSVLTLLLIVSSLRLEVALLTVAEHEVDALLRVSAWLCLVTAMLAFMVALLLTLAAGEWSPAQRVVALLLPGLGLLAGWNQLFNYLCLRRQDFDTASNAKVVQAAGYAGAALGLGMLRPSSMGLMLADALGRLTATGFMARRLGLALGPLLRRPRLAEMACALQRHRSLTRTGLGAALVNAAGSSFTALMLLWLFSAADAGQYAMVDRFIGLPVGLMVGAASQVFMSHLGQELQKSQPGAARELFRRVVVMNVSWALIPAALLFLAGPWLLPQWLGPQWQRAGQFVQALTPLYLMAFAVGPVNMALTVAGRQGLQFGWDAARLATMAVLWLLVWHWQVDALTALWLFSAAACLTYLAYLGLADAALRALAAGAAAPRAVGVRLMITVVDYGVGNIGALLNMLDYIGVDAQASGDAHVIAQAERLVLPGVGAFDKAMTTLRTRALIAPLNAAVLQRRVPVLGVCLGMQLLARRSDEGVETGLGWIAADVRRIVVDKASRLKVPHIGWMDVQPQRGDALFLPAGSEQRFYFDHGYHMVCDRGDDVTATIDYGSTLCCGVQHGHVHGVQFHPEKSHRHGMALLERFARWQPRADVA